MRTVLFSLLTIGTMLSTLYAQDKSHSRRYSISALFSGGQIDFVLPIWAGEKTVFAPSFGVIAVEDFATEFRFGFILKQYKRTGKISPYYGVRAGGILLSPAKGENSIDKLFGILWGGEYFFDKNFSIGIEAQGNFLFSKEKSQLFGNQTKLSFNTATALLANIYF